jgi:signal transduction histidine kinase
MVLGWRQRPRRGTAWFVVLMGMLATWLLVYTAGLLTTTPALRLLLDRAEWSVIVAVPLFWFAFALEYTGFEDVLSKETIAFLALVPIVTIFVIWTNGEHGLLWRDVAVRTVDGMTLVDHELGPWFWVILTYGVGLIAAGVALQLRLILRSDDLYTDQALALVVAFSIPTLVLLIDVLEMTPANMPELTPFTLLGSGVALGYSFVRSELLSAVPATRRIGRDTVLENMHDGVLVVDGTGTIVDANPIVQRIFRSSEAELVGTSLTDLCRTWDIDLPTAGESFEVSLGDANRTYEVTISRIDDRSVHDPGRVLVFRDMTVRYRHKQQLQVLNRVLRHNLRNDVTAIVGQVEHVRNQTTDPEIEETAERALDVCWRLSALGDKASSLQTVLQETDEEMQALDLVAIIREVVGDLSAAYPDVQFDVSLPPRERVYTIPILKHALHDVVENACEHNDNPTPRVTITLSRRECNDTAYIDCEIADNGPGIPAEERRVLEAGEESALKHSSGLGLWFAYWITSASGGNLSFSEKKPRGTVVTMCLPSVESEYSVAEAHSAADP